MIEQLSSALKMPNLPFMCVMCFFLLPVCLPEQLPRMSACNTAHTSASRRRQNMLTRLVKPAVTAYHVAGGMASRLTSPACPDVWPLAARTNVQRSTLCCCCPSR